MFLLLTFFIQAGEKSENLLALNFIKKWLSWKILWKLFQINPYFLLSWIHSFFPTVCCQCFSFQSQVLEVTGFQTTLQLLCSESPTTERRSQSRKTDPNGIPMLITDLHSTSMALCGNFLAEMLTKTLLFGRRRLKSSSRNQSTKLSNFNLEPQKRVFTVMCPNMCTQLCVTKIYPFLGLISKMQYLDTLCSSIQITGSNLEPRKWRLAFWLIGGSRIKKSNLLWRTWRLEKCPSLGIIKFKN